MEDYQGAFADFSEAIRSQSGFADAYNGRGWVKYRLSDHSGAIRDFDEAIRLQSNAPDTYDGRGLVKFQLGKYQDAISEYQEAFRFYEQQGNVEKYFELLNWTVTSFCYVLPPVLSS
ncbi:MAG: tetratricopeptide repeat protein [Cyanothece sp. SIO1E1]|nr:tetratricopeptide repeat protein [Cyanothece sp. SIO1E1]